MLRGKRVLIVDDIGVLRYTLKTHLKSLNATIVGECENGYAAVQAYHELKPDLVTMDITMPQVNDVECGVSALEAIKSINRDAKVIMITSHGEQKKIISAISKGASGYVLKPIKIDNLSATISKIKF